MVSILASLQPKDAASASASSMASAQGGYLLSDSATRLYTRSELEPLSDYELYVARNEIFARHGRMFVNEDFAEALRRKIVVQPAVCA